MVEMLSARWRPVPRPDPPAPTSPSSSLVGVEGNVADAGSGSGSVADIAAVAEQPHVALQGRATIPCS